MTLDFTGRVAVVTGAGLGRAHAARGAHVLVSDIGGAVNGTGADRTPDSSDVTDPARSRP